MKCTTAERLQKIRADNPGWSTAKNTRWKANNPEKRRAHKIVENLLRSGKIQKQPCVRCGSTTTVQAHHDDYANPTEIMWLCQPHHRERHRELRGDAMFLVNLLEYRSLGMNKTAIAKKLGVEQATVRRWLVKYPDLVPTPSPADGGSEHRLSSPKLLRRRTARVAGLFGGEVR